MKYKVLIIGSEGFLGKNLKLQKNKQIFKSTRYFSNSKALYFDINFVNCYEIVKIFDVIIILSGNSSPKNSQNSKMAFNINNKIIKLINYAKKYTHVIFFSSSSVFTGDNKKLFLTNTKLKPFNTYGLLKSRVEKSIKNFKNVTILRLPKLYLNKNSLKKNIKLFYKNFYFQPLHILDLSKVVDKIIEHKITGIHNIGTKIENYADFFNIKNKKLISNKKIKFPGLLKTSSTLAALFKKNKFI